MRRGGNWLVLHVCLNAVGFTAECGEDLDSNISDWRYSFL